MSDTPAGTPSDTEIEDIARLMERRNCAGWADILRSLKCELSAAKAQLAEARSHANELSMALQESVTLQSHYAGLLNQWDGGQRIQFVHATAWLERLQALRVPKETQ